MVKDFNATGFTTSDEFMTNGDTPVLAANGLIDNPVNLFTGNPISSEGKNAPYNIYFSENWDPDDNPGNTFQPGDWFTFTGGDPHDPENWVYLGNY